MKYSGTDILQYIEYIGQAVNNIYWAVVHDTLEQFYNTSYQILGPEAEIIKRTSTIWHDRGI